MKWVLHMLLFLIFCHGSYAQQDKNIYDFDNSMRFAAYLRNSGQYALAIDELQRIYFLYPKNDTVELELLRSCRSGHFYDRGIGFINTFFPKKTNMSPAFASEYLRLMLLNRNFEEADSFIIKNTSLDEPRLFFYSLNSMLMQHKWKEARKSFEQQPADIRQAMKKYDALTSDAAGLKYKHAAVALSLSAVIPGSGKLYTRNWGDAIVSFVTTGALAFQAYRGFAMKGGINSAYGWVFGSLAFGFYAGNLYGSFKSCRVYNSKIDEKITERATALFEDTNY